MNIAIRTVHSSGLLAGLISGPVAARVPPLVVDDEMVADDMAPSVAGSASCY